MKESIISTQNNNNNCEAFIKHHHLIIIIIIKTNAEIRWTDFLKLTSWKKQPQLQGPPHHPKVPPRNIWIYISSYIYISWGGTGDQKWGRTANGAWCHRHRHQRARKRDRGRSWFFLISFRKRNTSTHKERAPCTILRFPQSVLCIAHGSTTLQE